LFSLGVSRMYLFTAEAYTGAKHTNDEQCAGEHVNHRPRNLIIITPSPQYVPSG